jgi:hypothetical protein
MTYPGWQGIKAGGPVGLRGAQVRQSTAGSYPGKDWTNVLQSMGDNAPAWGVEAAAVTVAEEVAAAPFPIESNNFQLEHPFGVDQSDPNTFHNDADPGYTGE